MTVAGPVKLINDNILYDATTTINEFFNSINNDDNFNLFNEPIVSMYHDQQDLINRYKNSSIPIVLSVNIRSIMKHHSELVELLHLLGKNEVLVYAIILQETWNISIVDLVNIPGFQKLMYKNRTFGNGGGVGIYIKNGISAKIINVPDSYSDKLFESITVEMLMGKQKNLLSSIYRSPTQLQNHTPNEQVNAFLEKFDAYLSSINSFDLKSYIFLDANIDLLNLNSNNQSNDYAETILSNGFVQTITKATRIQGQSISLIDHILTNDISTSPNSGVLLSDMSDHFITFTELQKTNNQKKQRTTKRRIFSEENITKFKNSLRNLRWANVVGENDVNDSFSNFWNEFNMLYEICFPLCSFKFNKNTHKKNNFMTPGLLVSRLTKNKLFKLSIASPSPANVNKYKVYRNVYNRLVRAMKQLYYEKTLEKNRKNPRKTWETLKELTTGNKNTNTINRLLINGIYVDNHQEIANEFNNFFTKIGQEISDSVKPTKVTAESFLHEDPSIPELELNPIRPSQIVDIVKLMVSKNSTDSNGISSNLIKKIIYEISVPLAHIFSLSINSGIFPKALKTARVVPIFKSSDPEIMDNYRPISLLNTLSKILEKAISYQLVNHLELNNLLYKHQYGFQKNKNTEHNLISVSNYIYDALSKGEYCIGLFLDLRKAFDVCSHDILLTKLKYLGIKGTPLKWFESYLNERMQFVEVNGARSGKKLIKISVMQGSILGPILFLCYINDLFKCTDLATFMFADNTSAFKSGKNLRTLSTQMNEEINKMAIWFRANRMAVNVMKTKYIVFHTRGKQVKPEDCILTFNANEPNQPFDINLYPRKIP